MNAYKNIVLFNLLFFGQFIIATNLRADGIEIDQTETYLQDDTYYLNASIDYKFSKEAIEALEHGISLYINIEIKTEKERAFIWNKNVSKSVIRYRLDYHPLSQRYLLTELSRFTRKDFRQLSSALNSLGKISGWPLLKQEELFEKGIYHTSLRAKLDLESLPAPLIPIAFISSKWRLTSEWHKWVIKS